MNNYFFVDKNGKQAGPIAPELFATYGVTGETLVWCEGMDAWKAANTVPELANFVVAQAGAGSFAPTNAAAATKGISLEGKPSNNLWLAVACTLFCCQPLGIVAIHYAAKVDTYWLAGNHEAARKASKNAMGWSVGVMIAGIILWLLFIFCYAAIIAAALSNSNNFSYF